MADQIPVWLLASTFELRGTSTYTLRLAKVLPQFGFRPIILCESAEELSEADRRILEVHEFPGLQKRYSWTWFSSELTQLIGKDRPALIHAQRRRLDHAACRLADRIGCPYLVTVHDILPREETLAVLPRRLGGLIAVSPSIERDLVLQAGVPQSWVTVIPSGVELPEQPILPAPRPKGVLPVVGTVGAFESQKGHTYFLMAAELILSSGYDAEFLVVGTGPEEELLRRAARHLEIANRVTFVSFRFDFQAMLEAIDVFVLSSLEQGQGTMMLEAMAMGKPVVATQVGGIRDYLVDHVHALLVPKANHVALADKIKFVLDNPDRARKLAAEGQQLVRAKFGLEEMAARTAELYRRALEAVPLEATHIGQVAP